MRLDFKRHRYLVSILVLGFVLMVYGIWLRAPFVMGPDEKTAVTKALWMGVHWTPFIPDFNKGGNLYLYVLAASFAPLYFYLKATGRTAQLADQATQTSTFFDAPPELQRTFYDFLLIGRLVSVAVGVVTVYLSYILARDLYGERAGLFAALSLSVSMALVNTAHYATEDALLTGLVAITFVLLSKYFVTGDQRFLAAASLTTGLATSAKATAAFLVLPIVYVAVRDHVDSLLAGDVDATITAAVGLTRSGVLAFGAYLLTTPSLLVYPGLFVNDIFGESSRAFASNPYISYPGWMLQIVGLARGFGLPLFLVSVAGLGLTIYRIRNGRGTRMEVAFLLFLIPYYVVVGSWQTNEIWYVVPLMPLFAVFAGGFVDHVLDGRYDRRVVAGFVSLVMIFSLVYTGVTVQQIATDARADSTNWIAEHVEQGADIDVYQYPLHLPKFPSDVTVHNYWFNSTDEEDWRIASERVRCRTPEYLVLSSAHYAFFVLNPEVSPEISKFYDRLFAGTYGYETVAVFGPPIKRSDSIGDLIASTVVPRTITNHDMRIVVLERNASVNESCVGN